MRFRHGHHGFGWHRRPPRLQRQLFVWLVFTICATGLSVALVTHLVRFAEPGQALEFEQAENFVSERFAERWASPEQRRALSESLARALAANVSLLDAHGRVLDAAGGSCKSPDHTLRVPEQGPKLGSVALCFRGSRPGRFVGILALATACLVLWKAAAFLARMLTRPLSSLIGVTREIGAGNLKSRVRLHRGQRGELGVLADAINDMAERIERQLNEQRELLAAVSHEVRSPLARLRVSSELLRHDPSDARALGSIESEVAEIDTLVGKLLASSRLDFGTLSRVALDAAKLAETALLRQDLPLDHLHDQSAGAQISADPTLVARALDNLLDNAEQHGRGVSRLVVRRARPGEHPEPDKGVVFEVWDRGPGFDASTLSRAFEAFYRGPQAIGNERPSLGLGLALVQRIAVAHGGRAWAENPPEGGARVSFSVG